MDAFFAAVEVLDHPRLRGLPVISGGSRNGERGVVCSATYEARRFGVRSAMPASEAKRLCPDAVFMPLRFARYKDLSKKVYRIMGAFSPTVQPVSIDEAFLDLSGEFKSAVKAARAIQERIDRELGLPASRSASVTPPTNATAPVFRKAAFLLRNLYRGGRSFTRVGIALSNLLSDEGVQLDLYTTPGKSTEERVDRVLDEVRKKLGKGAIKRARLLALGKNEYIVPEPE